MMKFQRGQAMVEFAIVLPFLFAILGMMIVVCLMFADYIQIQHETRIFARICSVVEIPSSGSSPEDIARQKIIEKYTAAEAKTTRNEQGTTTLPLFLYHCDISTTNDMVVKYDQNEKSWTVTLEARPKNTSTGLWTRINRAGWIGATCTMYSENAGT